MLYSSLLRTEHLIYLQQALATVEQQAYVAYCWESVNAKVKSSVFGGGEYIY